MKAWKRIEPTTITKVGWRTIVTKTFQMPDGSVATFDTYDKEGQQYVAVIALTTDGRVVIAKQFRPGPEAIMHDLPGGGVERNEEPQAAVLRELKEETGYVVGRIEYLGLIRKDCYKNSRHHYYIAYDCIQTEKEQQLDTDEFVTVDTCSVGELIDAARTEKMTDVGAVFLAYDRLIQISAER